MAGKPQWRIKSVEISLFIIRTIGSISYGRYGWKSILLSQVSVFRDERHLILT